VQIMLLRLLQRTGHKPVTLMGGGTTRIGDPSFRDEARSLLSDEQIAANLAGIRRCFDPFIRFGTGPTDAIMPNNADWLDKLGYIQLLREVGIHFSVNRMLSFDSVKSRLDRDQGLTFLEFNYSILQSYDFRELNRQYGVVLQMGGSDQWGNIVSGIDLVRRTDGKQVFGLTTPLITTASGGKMGKTAQGAVWLTADRLPVFDYWQFWRNTEDADVGRFLRMFTDMPLAEIARLEALGGAEINEAKKILATEATTLAHGAEAARAAAEQARDAAIKEQADEKAKFADDRKRHEQTLGELRAKQDEALAQAEQLKAITDELAKLGPLLAPEARRKFGAAPPEGQPVPWPERVRSVNAELRARDEALKDINATLARLRVADPQLQALVRDATPSDDRIDGFDGRIATVNSLDQTVLIVCDSTAGMRPGLALSVYPPGDLRPPAGARTGLVEVMQVEGPTSARARIVQDLPPDPILTNDGVATSLWAPGTQFTAVIVGFVQIDRDAGEDADRLKGLIEGVGGRVETSVTPLTTMLIDAGGPRSIGDDKAKGWQERDKLRRERELREARRLGVRVVGINQFMQMLGLGQDSLDANRLPDAAGR